MAEQNNQSIPAGKSEAEAGVTPPPSKVNAKVELDLDDAPFLEEDEPEEPPKPAKDPSKSKEAASSLDKHSPGDKSSNKKKKLILAGCAAVVLLIAAIVANMFFFSEEPAPPPVTEPKKNAEAPQPPPPAPELVMQWEQFWVELKDTEGAIRFLTLKFSIPTDSPNLFAEINAKKSILRDAIFYYLRNQPIISLTDEAKIKAFKSDILTVLNEHLGSGKIDEVLIQDYFVQ